MTLEEKAIRARVQPLAVAEEVKRLGRLLELECGRPVHERQVRFLAVFKCGRVAHAPILTRCAHFIQCFRHVALVAVPSLLLGFLA